MVQYVCIAMPVHCVQGKYFKVNETPYKLCRCCKIVFSNKFDSFIKNEVLSSLKVLIIYLGKLS